MTKETDLIKGLTFLNVSHMLLLILSERSDFTESIATIQKTKSKKKQDALKTELAYVIASICSSGYLAQNKDKPTEWKKAIKACVSGVNEWNLKTAGVTATPLRAK